MYKPKKIIKQREAKLMFDHNSEVFWIIFKK